MFKEIVNKLQKENLTIATMESCTGGSLVNEITNIEGASNILLFSAITYSNEYKIKMGVSEKTIKKYSVYSIETAREMAKNIKIFANADIGIGITGKLAKKDPQNAFGKDNQVFINILFQENSYDFTFLAPYKTRLKNKKALVNFIGKKLLELL